MLALGNGPACGRRGGRVAAAAVALALVAPAAAHADAGQLFGFGENGFGALGIGSAGANVATPTLAAVPGRVAQVAAGYHATLAVTEAGELYASGAAGQGRLGLPIPAAGSTATPTPTRVSLPAGSGAAVEAASGITHGLVRTATGQLLSFGTNDSGQLGRPASAVPDPTPTPVALPEPVVDVAAGAFSSYAVTASGQLLAWGQDNHGQLGRPATGRAVPAPTPVPLPAGAGPVVAVAAGAYHALALTATNRLYAFGDNDVGQVGDGAAPGRDVSSPTPVGLAGATGTIREIAGGSSVSLVVTTSGQLFSFGSNRYGQLGRPANAGTFTPNPRPELVPVPGRVLHAAAGDLHTLAVTEDGGLHAVGSNRRGALGTPINVGVDTPNTTPLQIELPGGAPVADVSRGPVSSHALAIAGAPVADPPPPGGGGGIKAPPPDLLGERPPPAAAELTADRIRRALRAQLVPRGRAARIGALRKRGGWAGSFRALAAGRVSVSWWFVRRPPRGGAVVRVRPVLVARGAASFAAAGSRRLAIRLTPPGRRLLRDARRLRVSAEASFHPRAGRAVATARTFVLRR